MRVARLQAHSHQDAYKMFWLHSMLMCADRKVGDKAEYLKYFTGPDPNCYAFIACLELLEINMRSNKKKKSD